MKRLLFSLSSRFFDPPSKLRATHFRFYCDRPHSSLLKDPGPLAYYKSLVNQGKLKHDPYQEKVAFELDNVLGRLDQYEKDMEEYHINLAKWEEKRENERRRLLLEEAKAKQEGGALTSVKKRQNFFQKWMSRRSSGNVEPGVGKWVSYLNREKKLDSLVGPRPTAPPAPKGLYIYGNVGSGKTMLMDMFYSATEGIVQHRRRLHFHEAMLQIHELMHKVWKSEVEKPLQSTISNWVMNLPFDTKIKGNFVLYGQSSNATWESFNFPTDTILGGQKLATGHQLFSKVSSTNFSTGRFRLVMQSDGNLVAYPSQIMGGPTDSYWSTATNDFSLVHPNYFLHLDHAGGLKLEKGEFNSTVIKQLNGNYSQNTGTTIYRATLDPDGNFRVYSNTSTDQLWQAFNDTCVKSFCGFNSFCTVTDYQPSCYCVPGTELINNRESSDGCRRNFKKQKCRDGKAETTFYYLNSTQKLKWEDIPYYIAPMSEEDCKKSCLEDCDCDAAEYDLNICNKYKFPLSYVSRDIQKSSTTFFKVGTRRIENGNGTIVPKPVDIVTTSKKTWLLILLLTVCLVTYSCVALATFGLFIFKTRVIKYKRLLESGTSGLAKELTLRLYSYKELKDATKGFKEELGKGSFGAVYRGYVNSGEKLVAVKRLQKLVEEGEREFQSEMRVIGKTHHKNLVRLLGYCTEGSNRLLVYEYMSNGSLADLLFRSERRPEWQERVRIAIDVAKGILYLHEECDAPIIHCDIKPQNILLDEFWTAKISDFGLAKLLMPDQTKTITDTRGTRGYVAPEWQKNMPISLKVDVYSYGIVLLEILCCRRNIDLNVSRPEEIQLSGWAYSCFAAGELGKLLKNEGVDKKSLERMVTVALWCIQSDPILRPSMKGVVLMLEGFTNISTPPCPTA